MPEDPTTTSRTKIGAIAGLAGAAAVAALVLGVGPAPSVFQLAGANEDISGNCDEAEHAGDPECQGSSTTLGDGTSSTDDDGSTSSTVDDDATSTTAGGSTSTTAGGGSTGDVRSLDAAGAGTVIYSVEGSTLRLVTATPTAGWQVEVEQSAGREVELDFRSGTKRVQVNLEIEDGQVRERVRFRDDADGTDIRSEDGVIDDDHSGPGSGDDDEIDDDDRDDDDHSGSGHSGSDDDRDDDSGSGSTGRGRDHPEDD